MLVHLVFSLDALNFKMHETKNPQVTFQPQAQMVPENGGVLQTEQSPMEKQWKTEHSPMDCKFSTFDNFVLYQPLTPSPCMLYNYYWPRLMLSERRHGILDLQRSLIVFHSHIKIN